MSASDTPGLDQRAADIPLLCATYVSENLITGSIAGWAAEIEDILHCSRRWNTLLGITGALLLTERHFVQVLEGPSPSLRLTLDRICSDPRHRILRSEVRPLDGRSFTGWSMGYVEPCAGNAGRITPLCRLSWGEATPPPAMLMMQSILARAATA
jgi:hypothetical protein